jgi:hypothetical protein
MANSIDKCKTSTNSPAQKKSGQAMVETLIIMLVTLLLLFGLLQVSHAFAGREILRHSAARAARARTVGFNYWMCEKVMRVAAIPTAGKMIEPQVQGHFDSALANAVANKKGGGLWDWSLGSIPISERGQLEAARIPDYLGSENNERAEYILDYEGWDNIHASGLGGGTASPTADENTLTVTVRQKYPLSIFVRMLNDWVGYIAGGTKGKEELSLEGSFNIESHYPLYLNDENF